MLSTRTIYSLAQFLEIQFQDFAGMLLLKHGLRGQTVRITSEVLTDIVAALEDGTEVQLSELLDEISRTRLDLRFRVRVNPREIYDERFDDLERCLLLDGYRFDQSGLIYLDPTVAGAPPLNDDLKIELSSPGLPNSTQVIQKLEASTSEFRKSNPNYNACLNDARVALETLATAIAQARKSSHPGNFDATKWGTIINYFRKTDFINAEEERGLTGVFGFVSPGSHRPLGLSDQEIARLGISFVTGMCW
ncbi:MAG: hypothetical protein PHU44_19350, partial [Syntrophales bacterium]|nr:hypothetical protein [Syntrophales bacterium]